MIKIRLTNTSGSEQTFAGVVIPDGMARKVSMPNNGSDPLWVELKTLVPLTFRVKSLDSSPRALELLSDFNTGEAADASTGEDFGELPWVDDCEGRTIAIAAAPLDEDGNDLTIQAGSTDPDSCSGKDGGDLTLKGGDTYDGYPGDAILQGGQDHGNCGYDSGDAVVVGGNNFAGGDAGSAYLAGGFTCENGGAELELEGGGECYGGDLYADGGATWVEHHHGGYVEMEGGYSDSGNGGHAAFTGGPSDGCAGWTHGGHLDLAGGYGQRYGGDVYIYGGEGGSRDGGDTWVDGGLGDCEDGYLYLGTGATSATYIGNHVQVDGTGVGFFGSNPVGQHADIPDATSETAVATLNTLLAAVRLLGFVVTPAP